jgi:hypothetical protein
VHGKKHRLVNEDVLRVEELLRKSIKLWITDKNNFSIKDGELSGGKLDTIFFG